MRMAGYRWLVAGGWRGAAGAGRGAEGPPRPDRRRREAARGDARSSSSSPADPTRRSSLIPTASEEPDTGAVLRQALPRGVRLHQRRRRSTSGAGPTPARPTTSAAAERARGIFFGGGDQVRILTALRGHARCSPRSPRRSRAARWSAAPRPGTACQSSLMITGEGDFAVDPVRAASSSGTASGSSAASSSTSTSSPGSASEPAALGDPRAPRAARRRRRRGHRHLGAARRHLRGDGRELGHGGRRRAARR